MIWYSNASNEKGDLKMKTLFMNGKIASFYKNNKYHQAIGMDLYNTNMFQTKYGTFPEVVIISSTKEYDLKGYPFAIKLLDYNLSSIEEKNLKF